MVKLQQCPDGWALLGSGVHADVVSSTHANQAMLEDMDNALKAGAMPAAVHLQLSVSCIVRMFVLFLSLLTSLFFVL